LILVDTSIWIDHLRRGNAALVSLLEEARVATHPFVLGELACGHLKNRVEVLTLLGALPQANRASHEEALSFLHAWRLFGTGLGWADVHLLASARLSGIRFWTQDSRLAEAAARLGLAP
jgi:hypothetical protein